MNIRGISTIGRSLLYGAVLVLPALVAACSNGGGSSY
jgi:hypothetical protein